MTKLLRLARGRGGSSGMPCSSADVLQIHLEVIEDIQWMH